MEEAKEIAKSIIALKEEAYYAYKPLVEDLCNNKNASENEVGLMFDWLLMYCDNPKVLDLYKQVGRAFYKKYPDCITRYIEWYREEYESNE